MLTFYDKLIIRHRPYMLNVAQKYKNIIDPEDLTQDACVNLWKFYSNLGMSTAQSLSDDVTVRKLSNVLIRNVALNVDAQPKFENSFSEMHQNIDYPCEEYDEKINQEFIDFMYNSSNDNTKNLFFLLLNMYKQGIRIDKFDICRILDMKVSTFYYNLNKIKEIRQNF
jgi:hypothetical protein